MFNKIIVVSFLFASFYCAGQQTNGLFLEISPSENLSAQTQDSLKIYLKDKKIIGLGEATHGTHEFFTIKRSLIQFLVEKLDFRIFALESNFSAYIVNNYINNRDHDLGKAIFNLHQIYHTQEIIDLINWMRQYNLTATENKKIAFYGIDNINIGTIPYQLLAYIERVDPNYLKECNDRLNGLTGKLKYLKKHQYKNNISGIESEFNRSKKVYVQLSSEREFDLYLKYLSVMKEAIKSSAVMIPHSRKISSFRDRGMANNVKWILNFEGDSNKIILWAHNGHIQKVGYDLNKRDHYRMGMELQKTFQKDYYAIGFDFDEGAFNAVDYTAGRKMQPCVVSNENVRSFSFQFSEVKKTCYFVDFGTLENSPFKEKLEKCEFIRHAGVGFSGEHFSFIKLQVQKAFDALIFVEKTTPSVFVNISRIK